MKINRTLHSFGFKLKKASPTIAIIGGALGTVAGTVLLCKETVKADTEIKAAKKSIAVIEDAKEKGITNAGEEYSETDYKKDMLIVYRNTGMQLIKTYALGATIFGASLASMLWSHKAMSKRNASLAAYSLALGEAFKKYRNRVVDKFGDVADHNIMTGAKRTDEIGGSSELTIDDYVDKKGLFMKLWGPESRYYTGNKDYDLMFLRSVEEACNRRLNETGRLTVNEVLHLLGYNITEEGQYVGWIRDDDNSNKISFGLDLNTLTNREYINNVEKVCYITFNHDGYILDKGW